MTTVQNPILRGFNPDPSVIRVGNDYYIATSTFEWFPGVHIHHSKDLANWQPVGHALNRIDQLDLSGIPDSCGVWAPCLSYDQGIFYLVYANVQAFDDIRGQTPNFLVTTSDIRGAWSDPVFLSNEGFDGSLFHDPNGKKWFTSMKVHPEKGKIFGGIIVQEYDPVARQLTGSVHKIFEGTDLGCTEGPHLYFKNDFYYLLLAEGGTEYGHAITLARSKDILGPYEVHPENPIITSRDHPEHPLQKAGHGDLVETPDGQTYCTYLVGRPLNTLGRCTLGRETAISAMEWREDGWLYAKNNKLPPITLEVSANQVNPKKNLFRTDFNSEEINVNFQSLRRPFEDSWISLTARKGYLRLYGQQALSSIDNQSLIARRIQAFRIEASTALDFEPRSSQHMAGLVCYYNTAHWIYACLTANDEMRNELKILVCDKGNITYPLLTPQVIESKKAVLKVSFFKDNIQFFFQTGTGNWQKLGPVLDGSILSDDYVRDEENQYRPAFTGAFIGLCCQDLSEENKHADFEYFEYKEL